MRVVTAFLFGLCFLVCVGCGRQTAPNSYWKRMETSSRIYQCGGITGSEEVWVPHAELPKKPGWNTKEGPPPISISQAIEMAQSHFTAQGHTNMDLAYISLYNNEIGHPTNFWRYAVTFLVSSNERKTLVILMDGRTYEPEFIPWEQLGIKPQGSQPRRK